MAILRHESWPDAMGDGSLGRCGRLPGLSMLEETRFPRWIGLCGIGFAVMFLIGAFRKSGTPKSRSDIFKDTIRTYPPLRQRTYTLLVSSGIIAFQLG